jgi:hypothetical protein
MPLGFLVLSAIFTAALALGEDGTRFTLTKEGLTLKLAEIGYKTAWVTASEYDSSAQGLYLARPGDPRSWKEIASGRPAGKPQELWRGLVLVHRDFLDPAATPFWQRISPWEMRIGEFLFFGDSDELDRIAAHW